MSDQRLRLPDGRWLGYSQLGDPDGPPILYFHGGVSSRLDIGFAEERCRRLGVRLLALDRPGVGLSDYRPGACLLDYASDVEAFAAQLGLQRCAVLGWSLGGAHTLACARALPGLVTRAATVGGVAPLVFPGAIRELGAGLDRLLLRYPQLAPVVLWLSSWVPPRLLQRALLKEVNSAADRSVVEAMTLMDVTDHVQEVFRQGARGPAADYRAVSRDWGFRLEDVEVEVLVYWGEEDTLCPHSHPRFVASRLPHGRLEVVPGTGHFLLHQALERVLQGLIG